MMFVPVPIAIAIPVPVPIPIAVPIPIMISVPAAIGALVPPDSISSSGHIPIGSIRRNAVVLVNILHAPFHAGYLAGIVCTLVFLPARVVAVKTPLVTQRQMGPLCNGGQCERDQPG